MLKFYVIIARERYHKLYYFTLVIIVHTLNFKQLQFSPIQPQSRENSDISFGIIFMIKVLSLFFSSRLVSARKFPAQIYKWKDWCNFMVSIYARFYPVKLNYHCSYMYIWPNWAARMLNSTRAHFAGSKGLSQA